MMMKHLILAFSLLACPLAKGEILPRVAPEEVGLNSTQLIQADRAINEAIQKKQIPGAVLAVVRQGKMAYLKAYGKRSLIPTVEAMTTNTIFDMASCSKPMGTAMAVMKLIEQGRLRLTDPVSLYIPGFKNWEKEDKSDATTIRIHHLLTHSSGLPAYVSPIDLKKKYDKADRDVVIDYICNCRRGFEPATDFRYSCLNFITLQRIVENITGETLRDFTRKEIFGPLGMDHTDYLPCEEDAKGIWRNTALPCWASAEERKKLEGKDIPLDAEFLKDVAPTEKQKTTGQVLRGQVHDPLARIANRGISGNAGVFTTADDIGLLCAMLQNGGEWNGKRILSPLTVKLMRSIPSTEPDLGRTLGWDCSSPYASNNGDLLSAHTYSHTGYTGTSIVIDPDNDISVILLINAVHPDDKGSTVRLRALVSNAVAAAIVSDSSIQKPVYTTHYYERVAKFQNESPITTKNIVMLGNSLTENGGDWAQLLNNPQVRNRGISGDIAMGVFDRLHQILPYHPQKIFLMIGINDVSHDLSTDTICGMIGQVIERIRTESPETKLYVQSLLPINESFNVYKRLVGKTSQVPDINKQLEPIVKKAGATYINLFPHFCEKGSIRMNADLSVDGLHLNKDGYQLWSKLIHKYL